MAKQVNLKNLQDSLARTKQYVDDKGGAMVYRTETTLWSGSANSPSDLPLSSPITGYDAVEFVAHIPTTAGRVHLSRIYDNPLVSASSTNQDDYAVYFQTAAEGNDLEAILIGYFSSESVFKLTASRTRPVNPSVSIEVPVLTAIKGINYVPMENYSTTEQIIGTWIDGSPVYQKTFAIPPGSAPAGGDYSFDFAITGVDHLIDQNGCIETSGGQEDPIPSAAHSGQTGGLYWTCRCFKRANGAIAFHYRRYLENMTITGGYVTFKYTKASS